MLQVVIVVNILLGQQVNGHKVLRRNLFFEDQMVGQRFDAIKSLQRRLLCNEEEYTAPFQTADVAAQQVLSRQLEVADAFRLEVFANDEGL